MLDIHYVPALVAASIAVAIMASFTSLRLTSGLGVLGARQRKVRVAQAAFALGGGIWSMHFVGMLSVELSIPIFYDPLRTMGSALIAILLTGSALMSLHFGTRTRTRIVFAGAITGAGIVSMHYLGMSAISGNCIVSYNSGGVLLAIGIAMASCILAMELAYRKRSLIATIWGSIALGLSISAMHYSAMMFTAFSLDTTTSLSSAQTVSSSNLAMIVAVASFVICGLFLMSAVPGDAVGAASSEPSTEPEPVETGRGRAASATLSKAFSGSPALEDIPSSRSERIPYERDKTLRFLPAQSILFVQADGHYSRIANGADDYFCPWPISRVEKSLDPARFIRTHRSYLVNKSHINGFRRQGDKGVCIVGEEREVPVSRGHISEIQEMLGL
jgi:NO-binding membrane sensor protein with MHYT domain